MKPFISGIVAMVDEATGYQEIRDKRALQEILDKFLRQELAAWAKRFPDEFYKQIFRLRGWVWKGMSVNRPQAVAGYTKDLVYARLAPGILAELEGRLPVENGRRKAKFHQQLVCRAHNQHLADRDFGTAHMESFRLRAEDQRRRYQSRRAPATPATLGGPVPALPRSTNAFHDRRT